MIHQKEVSKPLIFLILIGNLVRLADGSGSYEGRVEIFMNGQWGTVDDDPWDDDDAGVVCRQFGYLFGGVAYRSAHFGEGSGPIWLDNIGCSGSETHLLDCPHQTDTSEDSHSEDVGVACNGEGIRASYFVALIKIFKIRKGIKKQLNHL